MKYIIFALLITTAFICSTRGDVFEASSSEDASMFIRDDPHKNRAILFYDEVQEVSQKDVHKRDDKIISIFLKKGEKDRLKEDWVDKLKDEVNLMIVDAFKQENADIVRKFNVKATPYIIMFENHKTQFESIVDDKTFDKVKELLLKSEEDKTLRPTFSNDFVPPRVDEAKPKTKLQKLNNIKYKFQIIC